MPQERLRELTLGAVLLDREATRGALEETGTLGTVLPTALMSLAFLKAGFTARLIGARGLLAWTTGACLGSPPTDRLRRLVPTAGSSPKSSPGSDAAGGAGGQDMRESDDLRADATA